MKIERFNLQEFDSLESTNKYCELLDLSEIEEFTVVWAHTQTSGIGQRGNRWESQPDTNITCSLLLKPCFLDAADSFRITQVVALGISDLLTAMLPTHRCHIKWPNDILVDRKKICGTLITSKLQGDHIGTAICGIGLNVNQTLFSDWIPHPTSLAQLTNQYYVLRPILDKMICCIKQRYNQLQDGDLSTLEQRYLKQLLNYRQWGHYQYQGDIINALIDGVDRFGRLLLTTDNGASLCCQMKEISLLQAD